MESTIARPTDRLEEAPHALRSLRRETRRRLIEAREEIREHPRRASLLALGAGMLLSFLPLTALVTALLRLGLFIAKPALLILGVLKAMEEYRRSHPGASV